MPFYQVRGKIPRKRHTIFKKDDGTLFYEELIGRKGFSGASSLLYHLHSPAAIKKAERIEKESLTYRESLPLIPRHFRTQTLPLPAKANDPLMGRQFLLGNEDVRIGVCRPTENMDYYYRNGDGDEILFMLKGTGRVETPFGYLDFNERDYVVIPRGITYQLLVDSSVTCFLIIESRGDVTFPRRYMDEEGHLLEHSPFCERDIRFPSDLRTYDGLGEVQVVVKRGNQFTKLTFPSHPLDVVGWAGTLYPWAFHMGDFEPITGRLHMPPPIHQTFVGPGFVVCSFVPRLFDYHPDAIPAPYYHSNTDSDEVIFYVDGQFMSRKGMEVGSMTLHPMGLTHGPHPGKVEGSIGKKETREWAVMIDTFHPLQVTSLATTCEEADYIYSWLDES